MDESPNQFVEIYVDGGVFGKNPSPRGIYWSVEVPWNPDVVRRQDRTGKYRTNSEAEWLALREGLQWAVDAVLGRRPVVIYTDSRHVVDCFTEKKRVKIERLLRLKLECQRLAAQLPFVVVKWVPRTVSLERLGH